MGKKKKLIDDALEQVSFGVMGGVGGLAIGQTGGSAAGLQTMSGLMPTYATVKMGGHALDAVGDLNKKVKKL